MNVPLKPKPVVLHLVLAAVVIGALLAGLAVQAFWPERRWMNIQLHSAIEALGGLAAIVMAFVLLQRRQEPGGNKFSRLALGFLGMGILEEFHAVAPLGNGSVLLRSVASLVGGIGFALVWLPESRWSRWTQMPWAVISGCLAFGFWTLAFPDRLPQMIQAGEFAATTIAQKSLACVLFIAGAVRFLRDFHRTGKSEDYLFASLALLFGAAELMFTYSAIWDSGWWLWHVLRLLTYVLVLGYVSQVSKQEKRDRMLLMNLFKKHVSPEIVETIWAQRDQFLDGGRLRTQKVIATVLFTDLEGFTTVSEKMEPSALMDWLNFYMESMVQIVIKHGGVIDDYYGDSLKADFGVPLPRSTEAEFSQDAISAVDCALAMEREMIRLNLSWREQGLSPVRMRIGINTGPAVAGSLGSAQRLKYTTIGDTVNIASRLESFEKEAVDPFSDQSPCRILIGESTLRFLGQHYLVQQVGVTALKGKDEKITVYRVFGRADHIPVGDGN